MNEILKIEMVDKSRLDVTIKGGKHEVITMIVQAMKQAPEIAEAITEAAISYHQIPTPGKIIYKH